MAAVLAACGSGGSGSDALQTELSYLPPGSPLVLTLQTDPNSTAVKNTTAFLSRFPFTAVLESALINRLKQSGIDYNADVKPLFGNPLTLAVTARRLSAATGSHNFVIVWVTQSASALSSLVQRASSGLRRIGTHQGADLYAATGTAIAVDGSLLILGPNASSVLNALDRHANNGGISKDEFSRSTAGLPSDAMIYAFGNLQRILSSSPGAIRAARIPWVGAITRYGVSIAPSSSGVTVREHVDTSGSTLTNAQLPFAAGTAAPQLPSGFPIAAGLRDPQQLVAFVESAQRISTPAKFAADQRREARLLARTGANTSQLFGQLTGNAVVGSDLKATMIRSDVRDPAATAQILARLAKDPADTMTGSTVTSAGGFYVYHKPTGSTETLGVASGKLLLGIKALPAQLQTFATAPTAPAPDAQGSVAFSVALPQLIALASRASTARIPPALLASLGNLTGWVSAATSAIDGSDTVAFK